MAREFWRLENSRGWRILEAREFKRLKNIEGFNGAREFRRLEYKLAKVSRRHVSNSISNCSIFLVTFMPNYSKSSILP